MTQDNVVSDAAVADPTRLPEVYFGAADSGCFLSRWSAYIALMISGAAYDMDDA